MKPIDKLIELLKKDKVIPVIGAGVSYAVAKLPGWKASVENGLEFAFVRGLINEKEYDDAKNFLENGKITEGAKLMKKYLNSPNHPFADWLEDLFGNPQVVNTDLIKSINNLCSSIILTTNYDDLLYSTTKIKTKKIFDWTQYEETLRAINKNNELLLHLHGVFDKPKTIILSSDDYQNLKNELGYKSVLQKLWCDYHFLFIGCSKDGVMDDDFRTVFNFLNQWFPSIPHSHFILMNQKDIELGLHKELIKLCNIEAISYGFEHSSLSQFINEINPNFDKLDIKLEQLVSEIKANFRNEKILSDGRLVSQNEKINTFIKDSLPNKTNWIDSIQLRALEEIWEEFNKTITSKAELFSNYQSLVLGLTEISTLNEKIEFWRINRDKPSILNQKAFIELAILSYECLGKFPKELLEEIRHREPYVIHDYYYTGYLGSFVNEYKNLSKITSIDLKEYYSDDKYFFENLKRIISSLEGLLNLKPFEVFKELPQAIITKDLIKPFLIFSGNKNISLRNCEFPYEQFANLPLEENIEFRDFEFIMQNEIPLIVGHTSLSCFYWSPLKDLVKTNYFNAGLKTAISQVINRKEGNVIYSNVFCGNKLLKFHDFMLTEEVELRPRLSNYILLDDNETFIGINQKYGSSSDNILFKIKGNKCLPLLNSIELYNLIKDIPEFMLLTKTESGENDNRGVYSTLFQPFLDGFEIKKINFNAKEIIAVKAKINELPNRGTCILCFEVNENIFSVVNKILLPYRSCIAFDFKVVGNRLDLICGYLSTGSYPKQLVQYFKEINKAKGAIVASDEYPSIIKSDGTANMDVYNINFLNSNRVIAIQGNNKFYDIDLLQMEFKEFISVENDLKKIIQVL